MPSGGGYPPESEGWQVFVSVTRSAPPPHVPSILPTGSHDDPRWLGWKREGGGGWDDNGDGAESEGHAQWEE